MIQNLINFLRKAIESHRRNRAIKETINELRKLSNRELNDIGLGRGDIWTVAHESHPEDKVYANPNLRGFV